MGWNDHFLDAGEDEKEEAMTHEEKAKKINQAQMWFHYLQIPREATYADVIMFEKIHGEALASAEKKAYENGREDGMKIDDWNDEMESIAEAMCYCECHKKLTVEELESIARSVYKMLKEPK